MPPTARLTPGRSRWWGWFEWLGRRGAVEAAWVLSLSSFPKSSRSSASFPIHYSYGFYPFLGQALSGATESSAAEVRHASIKSATCLRWRQHGERPYRAFQLPTATRLTHLINFGRRRRSGGGLQPAEETYGKRLHQGFNGRFLQECLNENWFLSLEVSEQKVESWADITMGRGPYSAQGSLFTREFCCGGNLG